MPVLHPNASIHELSEALATGKLTATQLVSSYLDRIRQLDGALGAFREVYFDSAVKAAEQADQARSNNQQLSPLHGIPFAVKDLFDVAGKPTTAGTHLLQGNIASRHATAVRRLLDAGMILLGKTNTVQFAYSGVGVNSDQGTPHNPWAQEPHVPGGSSSGSAVAVSAGLVPVALGTDTGGSVRIPACLTGITGLKTTVGQVSRAGVYPLSWSLDSVGPLCNSAADAATLFRELQGADQADPSTRDYRPQNVSAVSKAPGANPRGLRVAIANGLFFEDTEPAISQAVRDAGDQFAALGARVEEIDFGLAAKARALNPKGLIIAAEAYAVNRDLVDKHLEQLDPWVAPRVLAGKEINAADYAHLQNQWQQLRSEAMTALAATDILLAPTTPISAQPLTKVTANPASYTEHNLAYLRNTTVGNILNLCGLSVPCGETPTGMPIGLMIYAKPFCEADALRAGIAYQQATQFHRRTPDLSWVNP